MKYKHLKTGIIATEHSSALGHPEIRSYILSNHVGLVSGWLIEDSCDWEKIEEDKKDYVITSFKSPHTTGNCYLKDNGMYSHAEYVEGLFTPEQLFKQDFSIYSVKRLKDGVEFKIGDEIIVNNERKNNPSYIINKLLIVDNNIKVNGEREGGSISYFIENLSHYVKPKVLYTTEELEEIKNKISQLQKLLK